MNEIKTATTKNIDEIVSIRIANVYKHKQFCDIFSQYDKFSAGADSTWLTCYKFSKYYSDLLFIFVDVFHSVG